VGIALVLFPAAANMLTDAGFHGFSSTQYGSLFIPQFLTAILSSLGASWLSRKWGMKPVLLLGLVSMVMAMLLMASSHWFMEGQADYVLMLLATSFMGAGFGLTITALNPLAFNLFRGLETSAVTAMHIMLGLGTAASAVYLNVFVEMHLWWGAPLSVAAACLGIFVFSLPLQFNLIGANPDPMVIQRVIPRRILWFALAVFLYGLCEAALGNFGAVFLEREGGLPPAKAALGLSLFWLGITIGRIAFTAFALRFPVKGIFMAAPFFAALVFYFLPMALGPTFLFLSMGLGGLGLSFIFPNAISTATREYPEHSGLVSGAMVAALQFGTGVVSQLIGKLNESFSLGELFRYTALVALALGVLISLLMVSRRPD